MQSTQTVASKAVVAVVAAAMIFSAFAAPVKAQTVEDLQAQLKQLMDQIAALQGGSATSGAAVCPYTWTRDLRTGMTGADVKVLQQFLNSNADTRVAATGAGSAGMETEYFGPATAAAVSKMQVMYRADVLTPSGLTNPTGFFGPSTRAKANALCVAAPVTPVDPDDEDEEDEDDETVELSGEASLDEMTLESADDDEIEEGETDAVIAEMEVTFQDGDASISRIDVTLDGADDVWDAFETVSLWVDDEMVAEMDAADEDDYLDTTGNAGTLRFSGLDIVAMEDEDLTIVIAATLQNSIDTTGSYNVAVDAIRFFDADGVATTEDEGFDFGDSVSFTIDEAGAEDELIAKTSSEDPDATTLQVEDDAKSDWYTVFVFDLDTDDSTNDIELNTIRVDVTTNGNVAGNAGFNDLVDDVELVIDGVTIDDVEIAGATTTEGTAELTFDVDGDVVIEAGDRVAAELKLRFKALPSGEEGATVQGSISSLTTTIVDAEGADDLENSQLSGSATGDTHTLRTTGVDVAVDTTSAVATDVDGADNDYATFKITLDVTAFEQDVFIPVNAASSTWKLVDGNGVDITAAAASTTVVIDSSAEEGGAGDAFFEINEGQTETVTITVTYTPGTASPIAARLQLQSLAFDASGTVVGTDDQTWSALPANSYRTSVVTIQN